MKFCRKWLKIILVLTTAFAIILASAAYISFKHTKQHKYDKTISRYCNEFNVEENIIKSIIYVESNFNSKVTSSKGAIGLMQILPSTAVFISKMLKVKEYDLYNPDDNIRFGTAYYCYLNKKFKDSYTAIAAYNAGEGNVLAWLKLAEYSLDGITLKQIPFNETKRYVERIKSRQKILYFVEKLGL